MSTRVSASRLRVPTPAIETDAANKSYVDTGLAGKANTGHTHTLSQVSDMSTIGRNIGAAADGPAVRTLIGAGTSNLAIGTTSTTAAAGNDARLTDARVPLDNSVTNVKIPAGAAIDPTKLGTGRVIAMDGAGALLSITKRYLSQAQYDAIGTKDPNTEYNII